MPAMLRSRGKRVSRDRHGCSRGRDGDISGGDGGRAARATACTASSSSRRRRRIELATRLGDRLGKRNKAHVTWSMRAHAFLETSPARNCRRSMDIGVYRPIPRQAHWHYFRYRIGEMIGLDRARRQVVVAPFIDEEGGQVTPLREFSYDTLVMAVGSLTNDFGTPGAKEYAISLETPVQAERFHRRLVNAYIRAHAQAGSLRPEQLQVALIGAGATGVELAAELHNTTRTLVSYGLDRIDPEKDMKLILVEAADRILPRCRRAFVCSGQAAPKLNVNVLTSARVAEVLPDGSDWRCDSFRQSRRWGPGKVARFSQDPSDWYNRIN